ncbi:hypothetical protein [Mycobacterium sp. AT1]|uniref:hypothetical protein n=1 Tax=Mycobacterium sp. AT1 TaxID=1961706 RepID=UPI0009ADC7B9|nr:hypothetical protein [Mycobacterium sp. AT1]OPX11993.1 hypothetical protein B1790_06015 [Mycobacterium sp. AT1]
MKLEQVRIRAAFHEAGHAVAALRRGGYVTYINLTDPVKQLQETSTDIQTADRAFMTWAGPWTQARWEGNPTMQRAIEILQTQSFFDWKFYEKQFGNDVDAWADAAEEAQNSGQPMPENRPPVTPPLPGWFPVLDQAWPEIEQLANKLIRRKQRIELSNGRVLEKDGLYNQWADFDHPKVVDDPSLPAVR